MPRPVAIPAHAAAAVQNTMAAILNILPGSAYDHDEKYHWIVCINCHKPVFNKQEHFALCTDPNHCESCGIEFTPTEVEHYDAGIIKYDEDEHRNLCAICNHEFYRSKHYTTCSTPNECDFCGAKCSPVEIIHVWDYDNMKFDETHHWIECKYCDTIMREEEHVAYCNKLGVCTECGQPYTGPNMIHDVSEWKFDSTSHWDVCLLCGEKVHSEIHGYWCDSTDYSLTKCYCGYEGDISLRHADGHWEETPATCLVDGSRVFTCSACKTTKTETIKAPANTTKPCKAKLRQPV